MSPSGSVALASSLITEVDVKVLPVEGVNVYDLLFHEKIVCTSEAVKKLGERLG